MKVTDVRLRKIQTDGEFRDIAHPINSDMRQEIQDAVMKVYDETDEVVPDKNATSEDSEEA
ncbi:TPA: septation protein SpoVG family protein [Staphylococcus aureus]|nr:septation protein SpoVG family protein [Staphylococcus aureus]